MSSTVPIPSPLNRSLFLEQFGALATHEEKIPLEQLESRTLNNTRLKCERSQILVVDKMNDLSAVALSTFFEGKNFFQRLSVKFGLYQQKPLFKPLAVIQKRLEELILIANEFNEKPFSTLQELRDRGQRIKILREEQESLIEALGESEKSVQEFRSTLNRFEKALFKTILFCRSLFTKMEGYYSSVPILPMTMESYLKKEVVLAETKLGETPVVILARLGCSNKEHKYLFSGKVHVTIVSKDDREKNHGNMVLSRHWSTIDPPSSESHIIETEPLKEGTQLKSRSFYFQPVTHVGSSVAHEILRNVALEIFSREDDAYMTGTSQEFKPQLKRDHLPPFTALLTSKTGPILPTFFNTNFNLYMP